jgi:hypothetical protein
MSLSAMSFLLDPPSTSRGPKEVVEIFAVYSAYLESIRNALPQSAYEFAIAPWHLSEQGLVLHEVLFKSGSRWLIEAKDIRVHWAQS